LSQSPFNPEKNLSDREIASIFKQRRYDFFSKKNKNLNYLLRKRYSFIEENLINKDRILEIGSGAGLSKSFISAEFISSDIIDNKWIDVCCNVENIPYPDNYFDAVFSSNAFLHFDNPVKALKEMERVLCPGGILIINDIKLSLCHKLLIKILKHEGYNHNINPYKQKIKKTNNTFYANGANLDLLLRDKDAFKKNFNLSITNDFSSEFFLYLFSGGVTAKYPTIGLPNSILSFFSIVDSFLITVAPKVFGLSRTLTLIKSRIGVNVSAFGGWSEERQKKHFCYSFKNANEVKENIDSIKLAIGFTKSYGDSCTSENNVVFNTKELNQISNVNYEEGTITCQSGVSVKEINQLINKNKFILPVTPGFENISVGGAIANDVHGKNYLKERSFGDHVLWLKIVLHSGKEIKISKITNFHLFEATIGGLGLTGVITEACIKIKKVCSLQVQQENILVRGNKNFFNSLKKLSECNEYIYGVMDFHSSNQIHILKTANFIKFSQNPLIVLRPLLIKKIFFSYIFFKLGRLPIKFIYKILKIFYRTKTYRQNIKLRDFLYQYPSDLSKVEGLQIQYVIAEKNTLKAFDQISNLIFKNGTTVSLLTVKYFDNSDPTYLSFPQKGFAISIDMARSQKNLDLLENITKIVAVLGGKIYLAKDCYMRAAEFEKMYPKPAFIEVIKKFNGDIKFISDASRRLGISEQLK
jgi:decaprenylphospho-beta-D-ribofuranose 2-oxidase